MKSLTRLIGLVFLVSTLSACGVFGGGGGSKGLQPRTTAIGVNGYLWQATLDTLSFMPIDQAEPASGVIITDWQFTPGVDNERVKVTVQFLSQRLRSDGIRVTVLRQNKEGENWVTVPVQASTALQIEEAILVQARNLRSRVR